MQLKPALAAMLLAGTAAVGHAAILFQAIPGGAVAGGPGSTVGWGFTLSNDTANYLVVTGSQFSPTPLSFIGTYQDLIGTGPLIVLGPNPEAQSLTEQFNLALGTGVGAFHFAPTASGTLNGQLIIDYALFSVDPNDPGFDPGADLVLADGQVSAQESLVATPEPSSLLLVAGPVMLGLCRIRRRRR